MEAKYFWKCKCDRGFIHRRDQEGQCPSCKASCLWEGSPQAAEITRENMYRENIIPVVIQEKPRAVNAPGQMWMVEPWKPTEAERVEAAKKMLAENIQKSTQTGITGTIRNKILHNIIKDDSRFEVGEKWQDPAGDVWEIDSIVDKGIEMSISAKKYNMPGDKAYMGITWEDIPNFMKNWTYILPEESSVDKSEEIKDSDEYNFKTLEKMGLSYKIFNLPKVEDWIKWIAIDSDGSVWGHEVKPGLDIYHSTWHARGKVKYIFSFHMTDKLRFPPGVEWTDSIFKRPPMCSCGELTKQDCNCMDCGELVCEECQYPYNQFSQVTEPLHKYCGEDIR